MKKTCDKPVYPVNAYCAIFGETVYPNIPPDAEERLDYVVRTLYQREADMFMLRYRDGMIYAKIGAKYSLSKERVRQIIVKVERKLRHPRLRRVLLMGRETYLDSLAATNEEKERPYKDRTDSMVQPEQKP